MFGQTKHYLENLKPCEKFLIFRILNKNLLPKTVIYGTLLLEIVSEISNFPVLNKYLAL